MIFLFINDFTINYFYYLLKISFILFQCSYKIL